MNSAGCRQLCLANRMGHIYIRHWASHASYTEEIPSHQYDKQGLLLLGFFESTLGDAQHTPERGGVKETC